MNLIPLNLSVFLGIAALTRNSSDFLNRQLIHLLQESRDPVVLAVAVHDVGMYVKYYEKGKQ